MLLSTPYSLPIPLPSLPHLTSVPETDPESSGRLYDVMHWINALRFPEHIDNRDCNQMWRLERDHVAPLLFLDSSHGGASETRREQPVVTRRHTSALKMPKH